MQSEVLGRLRAEIHRQTIDILPKQEKFAILDFPDYHNIGDSAIYMGEIALLRERGLRPSYVSTPKSIDWESLDRETEGGPIFINGGGNFGDLWTWFQTFREEILRRYPGRRVVQLPQTIYYRSQGAIDRTARLIEKHRAFTLLVRDQPSFDLARKHFSCDVRLCPDMAFALPPLKRHQPRHELLFHLREDQEASFAHDTSAFVDGKRVIRADWPQEGRYFRRLAKVRATVASLPSLPLESRHLRRERLYRTLAKKRLARGVRLLSSGRALVTDRLHGHILSLLLGIPHCVIDNSYGKTSSFMSAWETGGGNVHFASNIDEATAKLKIATT